MQIADTFSGNAPLPSSAGDAQIAGQKRRARMHYRWLHFRRSFRFWWYRVLVVVLGTVVTILIGPLLFTFPKEFLGGAAALVLFFWAIRRLEVGLLLLTIFATAFSPKAVSLKSVDIYPVEILAVVLIFVIVVQAAFHVRKFTFPSFWTIWPQLGLIALAIISEVMIQVTWITLVPHKLNTTPLIYSELLAIGMYCFPLMILVITSAGLSLNEGLMKKIEKWLLGLALAAAAVVGIEFRRIGADIYTFRYTEPVIIYMSLRSLAQLMALGTMIAYARLLTASRWKERIGYALALAFTAAGVYFTLENSWWVELAVAIVVITLVYSRRLFIAFCLLCLPFIPLLKNELTKLQAVKSVDAYRLIVWQDALRVWSKRPILGVGPGNFWSYDQVYTHLPFLLRNFDTTGLGVAHNGTLQTLGELGPLGVVCLYSFVVVALLAAWRLYRRSASPEKRDDRVLGLVCMGLVLGSLAGDFFSGSFFLPPRQIGSFKDLPQVLTTWIMLGCLFYRDKMWRLARKRYEV